MKSIMGVVLFVGCIAALMPSTLGATWDCSCEGRNATSRIRFCEADFVFKFRVLQQVSVVKEVIRIYTIDSVRKYDLHDGKNVQNEVITSYIVVPCDVVLDEKTQYIGSGPLVPYDPVLPSYLDRNRLIMVACGSQYRVMKWKEMPSADKKFLNNPQCHAGAGED